MRKKKIEKNHRQGVVNKVQDCLPNCLTVMSCLLVIPPSQGLNSFKLCHVVEYFSRGLAFYRTFRTFQSQFLRYFLEILPRSIFAIVFRDTVSRMF